MSPWPAQPGAPRPRVAVLDDYGSLAARFADWSQVSVPVDVVEFPDHVDDADVLVDRLRGFDIVVAMRERTPFPKTLLERLPSLRLLVTTGPANSAIDVAAATELGIVVCGTGTQVSGPVELTWALILAVAKRLPEADASLRSGGWQPNVGMDLAGGVLGVLGLGRLGERVAQVGQAFGMDVVAWSHNLTEERAAAVGVRRVSRDELFALSDVVTIHMRLSERTRGLLGEAEFARMKSTAVLINTSRGPIVDEAALVDALTHGTIAGAGLDVFDREPLAEDHPLRDLRRTVLTPHLGYVTKSTFRTYFQGAVEDVSAFLEGVPIRRVLDPS